MQTFPPRETGIDTEPVETSFWRRPIPVWARLALIRSGALILLGVAAVVAGWFHFHQTYEHWLAEPEERLAGHPHRLIIDGEILGPPAPGDLEPVIDDHLIGFRSDHFNVVELSRSDPLLFSFLRRAYVKVFLHTQLSEGNGGRRVEFVSLYIREDGRWRWEAIYNLALE
jgi:hypothetical protein